MSIPPSPEFNFSESLFIGTIAMGLQTPFVHPLNTISILSSKNGCGMHTTIRQLRQGSFSNYFRKLYSGVDGHLVKEGLRVGAKASGLGYKPTLDYKIVESGYPLFYSDTLFAGGLALWEVAINPGDTYRTMRQARKRIKDIPFASRFNHFYSGSTANGTRQFFTWLGFPIADRAWSKVVRNYTSIDSDSNLGIALRSYPESVQVTVPVWFFERMKNELQYNPSLTKNSHGAQRYITAFKHIIKRRGFVGFVDGLGAKTLSNAVLVYGSTYLLKFGKSKNGNN